MRLASAGAQLFPLRASKEVLDELKMFARAKAWRNADRVGSLSLRRGAARAILDAGGALAQFLKSGQWHSSAYQLYLDLGHEVASAMASVLAEGPDDE